MSPLKAVLSKALAPFFYKKGSLLFAALPIAWSANFFEWFYHASFLGISLSFILVLVALMIGDFFTGIIASRSEGEEIGSNKLAYTFYKFLMYFLFFLIIYEINKIITFEMLKSNWLQFIYRQSQYMISFVRSFVFTILVFREYISIGENIERRFGRKPYIFVLASKIVDVIEKKLIKKIEDSDLCPPKDEKKN